MERKVRWFSRRTGGRLWMLATVALLFSLLQMQGGIVELNVGREGASQKADCCASTALAENGQSAVHEQTRSEQSVIHSSRVVAIPVSFEMHDVAIPTGVEQVFSHRRIDEFLQHETKSNDETQSF